MLCDFLNLSSPYFLKQVSDLIWSSPCGYSVRLDESQGSSSLYPPSSRSTGLHLYGFLHGFWGLNLCCHACTPSAVWTGPAPQATPMIY